MLSTTATFGDNAPTLVDALGLLLFLGGDDIGSRVDIFEEIFLVFMGLGTLVGIVVIAYTLKNAYAYRDGNEQAEDPKGRPQLGELPTGAAKGGRKLFLSFGISAIIVVSLIAWTYGMLLVVEGQTVEDAEEGVEIHVNGFQFGWDYTYEDEDRIPDETVEQIAFAVNNETMDVDSGDIDEAVESGEVEPLLDTVRAEASEVEAFDADDIERDLERTSTGMSDDGEFRGQSMLVPANERIWLSVTSEDVWHNFGINDQRAKSDAIPGETTQTWFETEDPTTANPQFDDQGNVLNRDDYHVAECFELCGGQHSNMKSQVDVVPQENFDAWYTGATVHVDDLDDAVDEAIEGLEADEDEEAETTERISAPATAGVIGA